MSSKASATELLIWDEWVCLQLQAVQLHSSTFVQVFAALILATHFPVKILLILIEPAASRSMLWLHDCIKSLLTNSKLIVINSFKNRRTDKLKYNYHCLPSIDLQNQPCSMRWLDPDHLLCICYLCCSLDAITGDPQMK